MESSENGFDKKIQTFLSKKKTKQNRMYRFVCLNVCAFFRAKFFSLLNGAFVLILRFVCRNSMCSLS